MSRRAPAILSFALLGAAACSGSSDGSDGAASATTPDTSVEASEADFCAAVVAIQEADFEVEETFGIDARRLFDDVQSAAPPEIADDVKTVIDTLEAIAALDVSTDEDDPAAFDAAFEILLDPDFTEANENLEEYTSKACGIELSDGDLEDLEDPDEV